MRGFLLGALVLVSLDVVLTAPSSRVAQLLATPAGWLAAWCDPRTPLITAPGSAPAKTTNTTPSVGSSVGNIFQKLTGI